VQDIKNAGAEFIDQEIVEDGNLVSSRHPGELPAFIEASLKRLRQREELPVYPKASRKNYFNI